MGFMERMRNRIRKPIDGNKPVEAVKVASTLEGRYKIPKPEDTIGGGAQGDIEKKKIDNIHQEISRHFNDLQNGGRNGMEAHIRDNHLN